ncbi:MAG TPA: hypothetical protein DF383_12965 [Deltaproteobacteria bacterium]|nr:hypothetical protein [Deltaproteobacteria bacterium]
MWIQREISNKILGIAKQFPALILTGARQVGKTSLLERLFPDFHFVSLELPSMADFAEKAPQEFIGRHPPPLIIDEVQYAPGLFRYLKHWIDQDRHRYGQFLLTGSQKFTLMKNVSESLAGRAAILELETLSWHEIQSFAPTSELEVILRGGFPELQSRREVDARIFFQSYVATYLERDVRSLLQVGHLRDFERFLRACALRSGQILNKSELARDVGVSPTTANEWLSVLQTSNQVILLEPWFRNKTKAMVKSPKLYLADLGLLCHLLGISTAEELLRSPLIGAIWETFIFSEIRKRQIRERGNWEAFFWRDLRGLECDFLIHHGGRFQLIETKFAENPDARDAVKLEKISEILGKKNIESRILLLRGDHSFPISEEVKAVSFREWEREKSF